MSQSEPNLTVVIPVHNAAPHLGACVESLLAQSYTDFELILVENGSPRNRRGIGCGNTGTETGNGAGHNNNSTEENGIGCGGDERIGRNVYNCARIRQDREHIGDNVRTDNNRGSRHFNSHGPHDRPTPKSLRLARQPRHRLHVVRTPRSPDHRNRTPILATASRTSPSTTSNAACGRASSRLPRSSAWSAGSDCVPARCRPSG